MAEGDVAICNERKRACIICMVGKIGEYYLYTQGRILLLPSAKLRLLTNAARGVLNWKIVAKLRIRN